MPTDPITEVTALLPRMKELDADATKGPWKVEKDSRFQIWPKRVYTRAEDYDWGKWDTICEHVPNWLARLWGTDSPSYTTSKEECANFDAIAELRNALPTIIDALEAYAEREKRMRAHCLDRKVYCQETVDILAILDREGGADHT